MLPSSSRPSLTKEMTAMGSTFPVQRFSCTKSLRDADLSSRRGVVIKDNYHKGAAFICASLTKLFLVQGFLWKAIPLIDDSFLLFPPDSDWRRLALQEGRVLLGDIVFPLIAFDPIQFDGGWDPCTFWVKIYGVPTSMIYAAEVERLIIDIGGFVLQIDPLSQGRENLKYLRLKIGVSARSDIPPCKKVLVTGPDGSRKYHWAQFVVEGEDHPQTVRRFWQQRHIPTIPPLPPLPPPLPPVTAAPPVATPPSVAVSPPVAAHHPVTAPSPPPLPPPHPQPISDVALSAKCSPNHFAPLANMNDSAPEACTLDYDPWDNSSVPPPTEGTKDNDPWEEAVRNENEKKRKGKFKDKEFAQEEPRCSLRVKLNQMVEGGNDSADSKVKSMGMAKTGTQFLVNQFPYSTLIDLELVKLYAISGFDLGVSLSENISTVQALRALTKPRFVSVINDSVADGKFPDLDKLTGYMRDIPEGDSERPNSLQLGNIQSPNG